MTIDFDAFLSTVGRWAVLDRDGAERATSATLRTLAERLSPGEARDIAAQLPPQLLGWLHTTSDPEGMDVDEFLRRVAQREGLGAGAADLEVAEAHARSVLRTMRGAISSDELEDLVADLPEDFHLLLADRDPMPASTFLDEVGRRAGVDVDQARRATDAVLETLSERIASGEVDDLLGRLPSTLHAPLLRGAAEATDWARRMAAQDFIARVAERARTTPAQARTWARAVLAVLREAVGDEEFLDVRVQLPADYDDLIEAHP